MKANQIHLLVALMATATVNAAPPKPPVDRRPPPPLLLPALDGDRDGALSADEIANSAAALAELDKNEDGMLSRKEISPPPPKKPTDTEAAPKPPKPKGHPIIVKALDLDKDGSLSADEIEDAPLSLATLDLDADGTISKAELKPGKPPVEPGT
jgi:hypothetical protein